MKEKERDKERKKVEKLCTTTSNARKTREKLGTRSTNPPSRPSRPQSGLGVILHFYLKGWLLNQREPLGVRLETGERRGRRLGEKKNFFLCNMYRY